MLHEFGRAAVRAHDGGEAARHRVRDDEAEALDLLAAFQRDLRVEEDGRAGVQRVEGFGHVEVRTATETIRGDRGVYVADTGIARLAGDVHITRGQSQLNGDEAVVNMRTGISTLSRNPGKRVEGLVVPNDATGSGADAKKPTAKAPSPAAPSPRASSPQASSPQASSP